jgi:hypothetical protein
MYHRKRNIYTGRGHEIHLLSSSLSPLPSPLPSAETATMANLLPLWKSSTLDLICRYMLDYTHEGEGWVRGEPNMRQQENLVFFIFIVPCEPAIERHVFASL